MDSTPKRPSNENTNCPIDLAHLEECTFGSKDLQSEVLALFSDHIARCMAELNAAVSIGDWVRTAHGIKGSAKAVGATAVAKLAQEAELFDEANLEHERQQHLDSIRMAIDEASHYIDLHLEKSALLDQ